MIGQRNRERILTGGKHSSLVRKVQLQWDSVREDLFPDTVSIGTIRSLHTETRFRQAGILDMVAAEHWEPQHETRLRHSFERLSGR